MKNFLFPRKKTLLVLLSVGIVVLLFVVGVKAKQNRQLSSSTANGVQIQSVSKDGKQIIKDTMTSNLDEISCRNLGIQLAKQLLQNGGCEILNKINIEMRQWQVFTDV